MDKIKWKKFWREKRDPTNVLQSIIPQKWKTYRLNFKKHSIDIYDPGG